MIVLAGVAMSLGATLLGLGNNAGWAFASFSLPLAWYAKKGWFVAHADADLSDAKPTTISTADGLTVSTDSRTFRSSDSAVAFANLVIEVSQRKALPLADGLVENGVVIPNSMDAANAQVRQINEIVEEQRRTLDALLNEHTGPTVLQRPIETIVPQDDAITQLNIIATGPPSG